MQYTKPMIELVYEIRRRVPSELKPGVKLANPDLFNELISHYQNKGANTVTKALIKELLSLAGENWVTELENQNSDKGNGHQTKMYRGLISLEKKNTQEAKIARSNQSKKKIYRGQVIA